MVIYVFFLVVFEKMKMLDEGKVMIDFIDVVVGLFFGEYMVLIFVEALFFEDGLKFVKIRGEFM